jgi:hypothetical protein
MSDRAKRIANNILEFLVNPECFPLKQRLYFGPEEKLQNETLDAARADSFKAYGKENKNSDFYPSRNRNTTKEASVMDRKILIASFDILRQNFADEDPIGKELGVIASVIADMKDEEYSNRVTRIVEAKAKTFKCPECGTKVLEQTAYCVKCKKKVKKASDEGCETPKEEKEEKDTPEQGQTVDASVLFKSWNKKATDAVRRLLIAEVSEDDPDAPGKKEDDKEACGKKADQNSPHPQLQSAMPAMPAEPVATAEPTPAPAPAAAPTPAPAAPAPAAPEAKPEEKKEDPATKEAVVDTDILASIDCEGISLTSAIMSNEDVGEMTAGEKAALESIMVASEYSNMSVEDKATLDALLKK